MGWKDLLEILSWQHLRENGHKFYKQKGENMSIYKYVILSLCLFISGVLTARADTLIFTGPSTDNTVHYTVKNSLSPKITRTIKVTASSDDPVLIKSPITQKINLLPGHSHTFTFVFDIACISTDSRHVITFSPTVSNGSIQTDPQELTIFLITRLNKCQQCDNGSIITKSCPEAPPCLNAPESCHPFSGCKYTPQILRKCNETVLNTYDINYSNDIHQGEIQTNRDPSL